MKTIFATLLHGRLRMCGMLAACALALSLLSSAAVAQAPAARIAAEVNGAETAIIRGSQHPLANPDLEAGRMPASTPLSGLTLMFNRSAAQEADLKALLAAQQDPASPLFHQWLTSDQFAERFGMSQADIDTVSAWLEQQGFSVDSVNRSHNAIRFSGTVGQVESAFGTQMHYYNVAGERHFAPATELTLPAAIAPVVSDIRNLNDFRPHPNHSKPRPGFTSGASGNVFFAPPDIVTAYDIGPLYSAGVNGAGQTITIIGQSYVHVGDVEAFQTASGLTKKDPTLVYVPGTGADLTISQGDEGESDLDLEWASAIAPGANVVLVYTGNSTNSGGIWTSIQYAVDEMIGNIISVSYSACEPAVGASFYASEDAILQQAAAQGQTVLAASGDQGSQACNGLSGVTAAQQNTISVNYPASSAYVTGVGGTEMTADDIFGGSQFSTYWNSNYNSSTKSVSNDLTSSLKQYVPEVVWNDDVASCTAAAETAGQCLSATGGGTSTLVSRPSWQTGVPGIASGTFRLVPDIAFYSSPGLPGFLYCSSDPTSWQPANGATPAQSSSCTAGFRDSATNDLTAAGGTSFATPIFAGMVALLNQKLNYTKGQGNINPVLYQLAAANANYTSGAIHDVTSGNNNCTSGTAACGSNSGGSSANAGYDEVTGIGSLDIGKIAAVWPTNSNGATSGLFTTQTAVSVAPATANVGASVTFTVSVTSGTGTPSGTVNLQVDGGTAFGATGGTTVSPAPTLSNGTLTYATTFTTPGTHEIVAQYAGDATHAPSVGVGEIVISNPSSGKGTIALGATNITVAQGSTGTSTITVTPSGGYTGTVNLTLSTSSSSLQNACYAFANATSAGGTVVVSGTTAASTTVTINTNAVQCGAALKSPGNPAFKRLGAPGHAARGNAPQPGSRNLPAGIAFAGLLLAGFLARGSRKLRGLACLIALGAIGMAITACGGGGGSSSSTASNPPKGTYTVTITGTDSTTSTITNTTTFTLTIN
ncbi:peptidase S53 [Acidobacteria bacterium AB60]|nr:peptidase S53 [Acidobacteria bacterium AB60]